MQIGEADDGPRCEGHDKAKVKEVLRQRFLNGKPITQYGDNVGVAVWLEAVAELQAEYPQPKEQ